MLATQKPLSVAIMALGVWSLTGGWCIRPVVGGGKRQRPGLSSEGFTSHTPIAARLKAGRDE